MTNIIPLFDDLPQELDALVSRHIHAPGIICPICGMSIEQMSTTSDYKGRTAAAKAKWARWEQACSGKSQR